VLAGRLAPNRIQRRRRRNPQVVAQLPTCATECNHRAGADVDTHAHIAGRLEPAADGTVERSASDPWRVVCGSQAIIHEGLKNLPTPLHGPQAPMRTCHSEDANISAVLACRQRRTRLASLVRQSGVPNMSGTETFGQSIPLPVRTCTPSLLA
jgi:hypothetical protein